ncbi:MarR family winged helix-turn-helix transcriptional regulator [Rhodococcus sp. ARC_M6]|uniref:MarR family winged helix-turn-helix transcriptional regulator n=1 Tax=Rhodococcus sp. ARC_M6 TaxID=2928852 RepID=UPI001FB33A8F|nr:MarR family transcriptional regulator [Rhodococcus sp. ARC_M6]MCJ0905639.1 MarR family transcriptional regulator [Rhodococcus sp. ARC_M6]
MSDDGLETWPTGRLLSTAARLLEHSWEKVLRSQDMTHAGLIVLHSIAQAPMSQRDIAKKSRVTDQTMSRTIDRLERAGFVTRGTDPRDERRRLITVTESGLITYQRLLVLEKEDAALTVGVGDVSALREQLLRLVRSPALNPHSTDG